MQEAIRIHATDARPARERLTEAVKRWTDLNLTVHELYARADIPVPYKTLMRWLDGRQQPGAYRLDGVLSAIQAATESEQSRLRRLISGDAA